MNKTRGIRNCNPANLRKGCKWVGLSKRQDDAEFCVFDSMHYGVRALIKTLRTYVLVHGLTTIPEILNRFAPPSENDTAAYIKYVESVVDYDGCFSGTFVKYHFEPLTSHSLYMLCKAICTMESGYSLTEFVFERALKSVR